MPAVEQTRFLQELAEDLNSKNIRLPSFPDVVINIRTALEDPTCSAERLASVVTTDPVLVARLLMAANSAFHNRAGIEIIDLNLAISRLGFEVVRNTAITLAVEQIFSASEHDALKDAIKEIWYSSLSLASMSFVIARYAGNANPDDAFLCGLLHQVGRLYILTKASHYPRLMGDAASLIAVQDRWYASVGKSIIEAWGFSSDIAESVQAANDAERDGDATSAMIDVVYLARLLLRDAGTAAEDDSFQGAAQKLNISAESIPGISEAYNLHEQSMRQSVGA